MSTFYIIKSIKTELKKSKLTYRDLAKALKISENGVKKMFSRSDLSLERAFEICKVLNISFSELVSQTENARQNELRFTDKQIDFLKNNIHYFHFYMKLAYEQKTPLQIQSEYSLSYRSLNIYLKKLEDLGLIKRHPKDRTQIVGGIALAVNTKGTELEKVKFEITRQLLDRIKITGEGTLSGAGLYLTKDESEELKNKLTETLNLFSILAAKNRKKPNVHSSPLSVMIVQSPTSMFNNISEI